MRKSLRIQNVIIVIVLLVAALGVASPVAAQRSNPVLNEFSASTTGTDVEYVEVYGDPDTDYSAFTILEIEGDSSGPGTVDEVIAIGTTDANGFWLGNLAANTLENGTITLLLVEGFSGALGDDLDTDDDGVLDVEPWTLLVDAVGVNDGGTGDLTYAVPELGPNYDGVSSFPPGGASRIPDGFDTDPATDWVRNDFDLAGIPGYEGSPEVGEAYNTPGGPNQVILAQAADPVINEFSASTTGTDVEYVEVYGDPDTDYSAFTILEIEGDSSGAGTIDEVIAVGTTDPGGFWLGDLDANSLENGTITLLLVTGFTGAVGDDLDTDNDGVLDVEPWDEVIDAVAVSDGGSSDATYGMPELGPNYDGVSSFAPGGASRIPDGFDTDAATDWVRNDFDLAGIPGYEGSPEVGEAYNTPGEPNQAVLPQASEPVLNEFSASTTGTDVEYVEVFGDPDTDYSSYTVLELEGDSGSTPGVIDEVISVGTTDGGGIWLENLPANTLENGTITLLLVEGFSGALGDDLDTDDDGVLDVEPWTWLVDAVGVNDGGTGDVTYAVPDLGPNYDGVSSFPPGGASRIPDGFDTDAATDWVRNDFNLAGIPGFTGTPTFGEAFNTPGAPNEIVPEPPLVLGACGDPATFIHEVQGSEFASPLIGQLVVVEGVVVGDFQENGLDGFFLQEEDTDADSDPVTSEGIFVFDEAITLDVASGNVLRVLGSVSEFFDLTEITLVDIAVCAESGLASATEVVLPVPSDGYLERFEGMAVTFPQELRIAEFFNFDRFGEIVLTTDRQFQPTAVFEPGSADAAALADLNERSRIMVDDGRTEQNPDPAIHPNGMEFTLENRFRGGDLVQNLTGVMHFSFGEYRVQPTEGAEYTAVNLRDGIAPPLSGEVNVAAFNVLNYFTTIDEGQDDCGPDQDLECRGADTVEELERQRAKIVAALAEINADIVGLIEIQNDEDQSVADLVDGLNDALGGGTYDYIETGFIGTDAIKQALIYKPDYVTPVGDFKVLDSDGFVDSNNIGDPKNRPALAQTFQSNADGALFTVVVNHLKSKGSACGPGDDDPVQGNCNLTRTLAAQVLVDWLATDPTGSGDEDFLIIGDLNAYDHEDPIDVLRNAGYVDLLLEYKGEHAYSYVFDGQLGYLDYALASPGLVNEVAGVDVWHINADEPDILDYDTSFKKDPQDDLYEPNPFRSSDHDPVLVGLDLNVPPVCTDAYPSVDLLWPVNHKFVPVEVLGVTDADGDPITITIDSIFQDEVVNDGGDGNTAPDGQGVGTSIAELRAERAGDGNGRVYHIFFTATDVYGGSCSGEVRVGVPHDRGKKAEAPIDEGPLYDSTEIPEGMGEALIESTVEIEEARVPDEPQDAEDREKQDK